jgi:hypothetical protein
MVAVGPHLGMGARNALRWLFIMQSCIVLFTLACQRTSAFLHHYQMRIFIEHTIFKQFKHHNFALRPFSRHAQWGSDTVRSTLG